MSFAYKNIILQNGSISQTTVGIDGLTNQTLVNRGYVTDKLTPINNNITTLQSDVTTIDNNITTLQSDVTTIDGQITTLQNDVTTIDNQITTINGEITTLQNDITVTDADITSINTNITTIQSNITTLQSTVNGLENTNRIAQLDIDSINSGLVIFQQNITDINNDITELQNSGVKTVAGRSGNVTLTSSDITDFPHLQKLTITNQGASTITIDTISLSSSENGFLHFFDVIVMGEDTNPTKQINDTFLFKIKVFIKNVNGILTQVGDADLSSTIDVHPNTSVGYNSNAIVTYGCSLQISGSNVNIVLTETDNGKIGGGYNSIKTSHMTIVITQS